ncbi:hypothetical protein BK138_26755 [Paenibacillus rhizosphaerae]|uniref:Uncharacterized protein n=1 Tax=Paenibacillus rhizosphaerae TaxID=297318 RepID=A0A1R1EFK6_9BACL|nr:hypothetical protein [Paenibacillus rhizosphaerae]OMF50600.1 hypothetical protein BK138_26755 [Paenibacillus rhizosphaerae]
MNIDFLKQLQRILRLKDLEAWDVAMNGKDCRIIIVDEGRPSRDEDFPWLKDGIGEDKRENHITAHVFSSTSLEKSEERMLYHIAEHLTDHAALAHCHVTVLFQQEDDYDLALSRLLQAKGYPECHSMPLSKFFRFSQD